MIALIDADLILHRAALVCETLRYTVYREVDGEISNINSFQYKKDLDQWLKEHGGSNKWHVEQEALTTEPVEYALHNCKTMINRILEDTNCCDYQLYLTPSGGTFRNRVSQDYKAHRKRRPIYKEQVRDYLIENWDAHICEDIEADDSLGMDQVALGDTVICSVDKDLLMIPGKHYNFVKQEWIEIDEYTGAKNFFMQLLTGDITDNIMGIDRVGPKTAAKLLQDVDTEDMEYVVKREYCSAFGPFIGADKLDMNAKLLWILRSISDKDFTGFDDIVQRYFK